MTYAKLVEHSRYVADARRTQAYRRALTQVVEPHHVVVDLGAGTGVLGILAAQAGARRVICVEEAPIASLIPAHAAANGVADRIEVREISSFDLQLDEPADVLVCDQAYGVGTQAALGRLLTDARQRFMNDDGVVIPASITIFAALVSAPTVGATIRRAGGGDGLAFPDLESAASNTIHLLRPERLEEIGAATEIATEVASHATDRIAWTGQLAPGAGAPTGIAIWWRVRLAGSVNISNLGPDRIDRDVAVLPIGSNIAPDTPLSVAIDIRPTLNTVTWTAGDGDERETRSTFHGQLLSAKGFGHR